ncbi:MAG: hypothetical protein WC523_04835 [Patescibacteria group bacterium]
MKIKGTGLDLVDVYNAFLVEGLDVRFCPDKKLYWKKINERINSSFACSDFNWWTQVVVNNKFFE